MSQTGLRTRWESGAGRRAAATALAALLSGHRPANLGLALHEGRIDLRGVVVPNPQALRAWAGFGAGVALERIGDTLNLGAIRVERVDLGEGFLPHLRFRAAAVAACRFDATGLPDFRCLESVFQGCSIVGADLSGAVIGPGSRFVGCDFAGARMRDVKADLASFTDCRFDGADLTGSDFFHTVFERCHFAGDLRQVHFWDASHHLDAVTRRVARPDPTCVKDCDFSSAKLLGVAFHGLELKGVKLPEDGDQLRVERFRCVLEQLQKPAASLVPAAQQRLREYAGRELERLPGSRAWGLLNLNDLAAGLDAEEARQVRQAASEAAAECARKRGWFGR